MYHKAGTTCRITCYEHIFRKFRLFRFQEAHGQKHHIGVYYFLLSGRLHGRASAILSRNPFHFFHLYTADFSILANKLIGCQRPAARATFFVT